METKSRSVSQLQSYVRCGEAYRLERVVRVPQRAAAWFVQGLAVHDAVEAYERSGRALSASDTAEIFETAWDREMAEAEEKQPDHSMWMVGGRKKRETDIRQRRELGRQQTTDYVEANGPGHELRPTELIPGEPAVEVGFDLDFDGVRVVGYVDLLLEDHDGRLKVRDIKTGVHVPADPYQMATYRHAIERLTSQPVHWGDWWMCKHGEPSMPLDLRPYTWERVAEWYHQLDRAIKEGIFLGNPGESTCFTCVSKPYCGLIQPDRLPWPVS